MFLLFLDTAVQISVDCETQEIAQKRTIKKLLQVASVSSCFPCFLYFAIIQLA